MRALLIVNPHATSTTAGRRDLLAHALAADLSLTVAHTAGRGHAADLAAQAADDGVDVIVVHAGDGTVNEVVNGMLARGVRPDAPALAVVPGGSTNVFARAVGIEADPTLATEQILAALAARRRHTVSLGRVGERYFTFNSGMGLDADVVRAVEAQRAGGRTISNVMHLRLAVAEFFRGERRTPRMSLQLAGRADPDPAYLVFVSNVDPWTYLGHRPVHTNSGTTPAGGLGVFAMTDMGLPGALRVAGQMLRSTGGPHSSALIRSDDEQQIRVTSPRPVAVQADGDYLGEFTDVVFTSVPRAVDIVV
ncbi:diacylglycerol kinase family lipid kinase [Nakamurella flavida]|uniref:Diacylglycerol kinase family lipid kinase n=1 Tax=Nakamurella flavida TaxID=363630 RepID=A0A939C6A9_9ACTN|nr:diacylglycerol kinase family protein [Nakamurella flavida]MBM9477017.1 diacylglycerol kinase family lipid kinase [Nakamurella flavida]MDP9779962.1 diacylglycerol kinase family enzyme [Nakamurella flavida]